MFTSGQNTFNDSDSFFKEILDDSTLRIRLIVSASECIGLPKFTVRVNQQILLDKELSEGQHQFDLDCQTKNCKEASIEISMSGKGPKDTIVKDGNIIKDKFIQIEKILINNYDMISDSELFYSKFKYFNNGTEVNVTPGFWHNNSTLKLDCSLPFTLWYTENTTKNISLSNNLEFRDNKKLAEKQFHKFVEKLKLLK